MKKFLLAGTALAAATAFAAPSQAAEPIKLSVGGFMAQAFGWVDNDGDYERARNIDVNSLDQKSATEIHFMGSTKLDNGISVKVKVELEADNPQGAGSTNIDESYMQLSSDMLGTLTLGSAKGAAWALGHRAPNKSLLNVNAGDVPVSAFFSAPAAATVAGANGLNDVADINRVTYVTPRFYGFAVGYSFTPEYNQVADGQAQPVNAVSTTDPMMHSVTLAYDETLAGVKIGMDGSYAKAMDGTAAPWVGWWGYQVGMNLAFAGFTVGGSWERREETMTTANLNDGYFYDLGVSYATGPYAVSVTYASSARTSVDGNGTQSEDDANWLTVGGTYNIGPGVNLQGSIFRAEYDDASTGDANENEGWGIAGGVVVTF